MVGGGSVRCLSIGFFEGNGVRCVRRTTRGLERSRLGTRISAISAVTAARIAIPLRRGGNRPVGVHDLAPDDLDSVGEGQPVGVQALSQRCVVDEFPQCPV
jgi:hypothetical protein